MKIIKSVLIGCMALSLLAACQTTEEIGNTPLETMPKNVVSAYQHYRITMKEHQRHNAVFAYNSSTSAYHWVGRFDQHGIPYAIEEALEKCTNCKVLDINGVIVWKNIDPELKAKLLSPVQLQASQKTVRYDESIYRISAFQLRKYRFYQKTQKDYDNAAFFVGSNGSSFGSSYSNGNTGEGYVGSIQRAWRKCQIDSGDGTCYLFDVDGEPVNEDAKEAAKRN